jgi:NAD(P)-dependent dehydrogenase (short-subunit alcohol dehydrogenase family)
MGEFDGKVAWITGGGSGIGRAVAMEFAKRGAKIAVSGRREDRLAETVAAIQAAGSVGLAVPCDVKSSESVTQAVAKVVAELGSLDVVVANAGFGVAGPVDRLTIQDWQSQFDVNVFGMVRTVQAALPELKKTRGRLVLIGSVASFVTYPSGAAYAASKAAVGIFGDSLYIELAHTGVSCTTIHPGFIESEIAQVDNSGQFRAGRRDPRPKLIMWKADRAARVMVNAIARRRRRKIITGHGLFADAMMRVCPGLIYWVMRRFSKEPRSKA